MKKEECSRRELLRKELLHDWDELNIAFKCLIFIGLLLFLVIIFIAIFSDGGKGLTNSIEVVFRSTLASVFGFLLSSNIKSNSKKKTKEIEKIQNQLKKIQSELEVIESENIDDKCDLDVINSYKNVNVVQIFVALGICILSIVVICALMVTNNLENVPAVSQIRDLMCSSIGFLIGESGKK